MPKNTKQDQEPQKKANSAAEEQQTSSEKQPHLQEKENKTGIPESMKIGYEYSWGISLDDVTVYYDSDKPKEQEGDGAIFYREGMNIYLASGQEEKLALALTELMKSIKKTQSDSKDANMDSIGGVPQEDSKEGEKETIAATIVIASESAPDRTFAEGLANAYSKEEEPAHDLMKTMRLMRICYALSEDETIRTLIQSGKEADLALVKSVVGLLEAKSRQIIQVWDNPLKDIKQRGEAWNVYIMGLKALKDNEKNLFSYIGSCLNHDKGYAQTHESSTSYMLYGYDDVEEGFDVILNRALNDSSNSNIWVGGMAGSGKYREQLTRSTELEVAKMSAPNSMDKQEKSMWTALLAPIMNSRFGVNEKDWDYVNTILKNKDTLYNTVRKLVPSSFTLHKEYITDCYSF